MNKLSGTIDGCGTAWVVRYSDHEAEIVELKTQINNLKYVQSTHSIKVDAINEMTDYFEKSDWHFIPTERMRRYAVELEKVE